MISVLQGIDMARTRATNGDLGSFAIRWGQFERKALSTIIGLYLTLP